MRSQPVKNVRRGTSARGMSLVELLVSMLLGLFLCAGIISAYLVAKRNFSYDEQAARMQENGRYAMRLLTRELSMAGFYGGVPEMTGVSAAAVETDCSDWNWALEATPSLDMLNDYSGQWPPLSIHDTSFTCFDRAAIALDTDVVAIKRTAAEASLQRGVPAATLSASTVDAWFLRLVSGSQPAWEKLRAIDLRGSDKALPALNYWEAVSRILFIRPYAETVGDGIPSLCMETLAGDGMTARCLVEGVENLQLEFGIDTDDDGIPNQYKPAPSHTELQTAVAVKIHLLIRSLGQLSGHQDKKSYQLGQKTLPARNDAYLRRVFSSTVLLRNYRGWRG